MRYFFIILILVSLVSTGVAAPLNTDIDNNLTLGEFILRWLNITVPQETNKVSNTNATYNRSIYDRVEQVSNKKQIVESEESQPIRSTAAKDRIHIVNRGETLSAISSRYGVSVSNLKRYNQLSNENKIFEGQSIILSPKKVTHTIRRGETLWALSKQYNVSVEELIKVNPKVDYRRLVVGSKLTIPTASNINAIPNMQWPLIGVITSPFGKRNGSLHRGVDIGAAEKTVIRAASAGQVILAGWKGSYGNCLLIQHSEQCVTRYAHALKLLVKKGEWVSAGQPIALVGSTGNSTGPHLHFEIIVNSVPENPQKYLPK